MYDRDRWPGQNPATGRLVSYGDVAQTAQLTEDREGPSQMQAPHSAGRESGFPRTVVCESARMYFAP